MAFFVLVNVLKKCQLSNLPLPLSKQLIPGFEGWTVEKISKIAYPQNLATCWIPYGCYDSMAWSNSQHLGWSHRQLLNQFVPCVRWSFIWNPQVASWEIPVIRLGSLFQICSPIFCNGNLSLPKLAQSVELEQFKRVSVFWGTSCTRHDRSASNFRVAFNGSNLHRNLIGEGNNFFIIINETLDGIEFVLFFEKALEYERLGRGEEARTRAEDVEN